MVLMVILVFALSHTVAGGNTQTDGHVTDSGIQEVFKRLSSLEVNLNRYAEDNVVLKKTVADLQEENQRLLSQVSSLQARETDMFKALNDLQKKVDQIDACDQKHDDNMHDVVEYITEPLYEEIEPEKEDKIKELSETQPKAQNKDARKIRRSLQRRENELNVSFFATLGNHLQHLGASQNIAFDRVITNIGNGYNSHAGDFRAPVAGTYVFSVTLMAYSSSTTHYNIVKNSTTVANLYVRGLESPYASSSMTAVLQLQKGEDVAIRNVDTDKMLHGSHYSAFSGFLLDQDFSSPPIVGK